MSRTHTADGRRISSMTHARRQHTCPLCGQTGNGNGFEASHGRAHVRRGEAVELEKYYEWDGSTGRAFLAPDDTGTIDKYLALGYSLVTA
jgi:hypothetical protein